MGKRLLHKRLQEEEVVESELNFVIEKTEHN